MNELTGYFSVLPVDLNVLLFKDYCSTRSRLATGAVSKSFNELVNNLNNETAREIWGHKLEFLKSREHWGIKTNPATISELFKYLNGPVTALSKIASVHWGNEETPKSFQELTQRISNKFRHVDHDFLNSCFVKLTYDDDNCFKKMKSYEWATINALWPQLIEENKSEEELRSLARKVFPHARFPSGLGMLHQAANTGHILLTQVLIEEGNVPIEQKSSEGATALVYAAMNGHLPLVKVLIEKYDANMSILNDPTWYRAWKNPDIAKLFFESGLGLTADKDGVTLLMRAFDNGDFDVVDTFLAHGKVGSIICLADNQGRNALMIACNLQGRQIDTAKKLEIIDLLLKTGASETINHTNKEGQNALIIACQVGQPAVIELLLNHGAEKTINYRNNKGCTALEIAAGNKNKEIVELLIKFGAVCY